MLEAVKIAFTTCLMGNWKPATAVEMTYAELTPLQLII